MPTVENISTTYAGEFAGKYIGAGLLAGNTLSQGVSVTIKPNIKYKEVFKRMDLDSLVTNASCDFNPTGSVTLTERVLEPKELEVPLELCKLTYKSDWEALSMGYSAHDNLPKNFTEYLIARVLEQVAGITEVSLWRGDGSNDGDFDGFATQIALDADLPAAQEITGTTVTAANVITELGKIVDAIPERLYGREDLYINVSQNIARAYIRALGGFGANGLGGSGTMAQGTQWYNGGDLAFDGVKIFVANGLASNTAIATVKDNLWFGTGLMSDHNEVSVLDMADKDLSKNVRFVMRYTAGTQYGVIEDIVTYGIVNAAN